MIFYDSILKDIAENTFKNLNIVVIYKDVQPSKDDFITNFSTTYSWTQTTTSTAVLQAYENVDLGTTEVSGDYRVYKTSPSGTSYGPYVKNTGTASWAVLFDSSSSGDLLEFNNDNNTLTFLRDVTDDDIFMIGPVSTLSSSGIVKFASLNFEDPAEEDLKGLTINFSMI